jgi:zona occludens toxin (predicted ATPase)
MISFYSGTPGSGKSFHVAKKIIFALRTLKQNVISTVDVDLDLISKNGRKKIADFTYIPILDLHPKFLYEYAFKNHCKGKEGQTLLIIDECQILFNPREYQRNNRADWILFFTRHRHLGYNIILISQFDRLIDRQIRSLFEYEIRHRKVNNLGILFFLPFTAFVCIETWYGVRGVTISSRFMLYRKKIAAIYDSYAMYDEYTKEFFEPLAADAHANGEPDPPPPSDPETGVRGSPSKGKTERPGMFPTFARIFRRKK